MRRPIVFEALLSLSPFRAAAHRATGSRKKAPQRRSLDRARVQLTSSHDTRRRLPLPQPRSRPADPERCGGGGLYLDPDLKRGSGGLLYSAFSPSARSSSLRVPYGGMALAAASSAPSAAAW